MLGWGFQNAQRLAEALESFNLEHALDKAPQPSPRIPSLLLLSDSSAILLTVTLGVVVAVAIWASQYHEQAYVQIRAVLSLCISAF
ncbi:hypothetical protein BDW75DRAFT_92869 [Aspergillus navahoensis]